jgi:hypothetical protein
MHAVLGIPVILGAAIGCAWGFVDALAQPSSRFREAHVSKAGLVAALGVLTVLITLSGVGIHTIHAPYHFKTLNWLLYLAATASALACMSLYLVMVRFGARSFPSSD